MKCAYCSKKIEHIDTTKHFGMSKAIEMIMHLFNCSKFETKEYWRKTIIDLLKRKD